MNLLLCDMVVLQSKNWQRNVSELLMEKKTLLLKIYPTICSIILSKWSKKLQNNSHSGKKSWHSESNKVRRNNDRYFRPIFLKPKQVDPLALPADASMAALTKSFPVSAGIQHREVINDYDIDKEGVGEWTEGILLKIFLLDYSFVRVEHSNSNGT